VSKSSKQPAVIRSTAEFARHVGLSRSAVSRVLNEQPGLLLETIERVHRAMAETGFTPNAHARHLRGAPTKVIGVCMENFLTPTAVAKVAMLQQQFEAKGYTTLTEMAPRGGYQKVVRHLRSLSVDGIVFVGHYDVPELAGLTMELKRHDVPHVVIDNAGLESAVTVTVDRAAAMRQVMDHLLDLGHRRFGLLGLSGPFQTVIDRLRGVHEALAARDLEPTGCLLSHDAQHERADHFDYGRTLAESFVAAGALPTAFVAVNDETAVGALLEFQARGLRVPEDVSVVGFNDQNICLMTRPRLTTVDQRIEATVECAVRRLLDHIERDRPGRAGTVLIPPNLVLRASTGPARKARR
jgi:DNA-binding LacI/PurR family transcriptional regulator